MAGYKIKLSSNVMVTLTQDKTDNCIGKTVLYSAPETMNKDHHGVQKNNLLVIFAKFAFDWSNISVIPSAFRESFKSVSATAVNLVGTNKEECIGIMQESCLKHSDSPISETIYIHDPKKHSLKGKWIISVLT